MRLGCKIAKDYSVMFQTDSQSAPLWVSLKEARRIAGLGTTKLYELIGTGAVHSIRVGGKRLIRYSSLEALGSQQQGGAA
jgi:hypothetical protein